MADNKARRCAFGFGPPGAMNRPHSSHILYAPVASGDGFKCTKELITTEEIICGSWRFLERPYIENMWRRSCDSFFSWRHKGWLDWQEKNQKVTDFKYKSGEDQRSLEYCFKYLCLNGMFPPLLELRVWRLLSDPWPQRPAAHFCSLLTDPRRTSLSLAQKGWEIFFFFFLFSPQHLGFSMQVINDSHLVATSAGLIKVVVMVVCVWGGGSRLQRKRGEKKQFAEVGVHWSYRITVFYFLSRLLWLQTTWVGALEGDQTRKKRICSLFSLHGNFCSQRIMKHCGVCSISIKLHFYYCTDR